MRKLILFFQIIFTLLPAALYAQDNVVSGTVKDISGILPGATVFEKGLPSNATITNGEGRFRLTLKGQSNVIVARFIGYTPQEYHITADKHANIDIILRGNNQDLNEVTIVGFTPQKRITSTGAVSSIQGSEIRTVPTANVQNTLAGRLPGITTVQVSGQPGKDASDFFIRGQSSLNASNQPLILVDDIEYTYDQLQQINVNEIETISILKDASSTAIYGIKGANGVLIVTTRRGKAGAPKFNFRIEGGEQSPTKTPKFLDSYQSATLVNQAYTNDGLDPVFNQADLDAFKNGSDPYGHPNTDWYDLIFRKHTYQANANLDISGGNSRVKYFISGGAFNQNGNTNNFNDPQDLVNTNYYFTRYDFRSNLDLKANKTLTLRLDVTTRFADINAPGFNNPIGTIYSFQTENSFSAPFINPNGTYAYNNSVFTPTHAPTLNAQLANGGYTHSRRTDYNVLVGAVQDLSSITDGLTLTFRTAFASEEDYQLNTSFLTDNLKNVFPSYYFNPKKPVGAQYSRNPGSPFTYSTYILFGGTDLYTNNTNIQIFSNYDRTFGDNHFTGLLLLNQQEINSQADAPSNTRGLSGKIGWDYKQKILVDANAAYNGSDRFSAAHRNGFFPAIGLGYVLSKEDFFKKAFPTFDLFKLRFSYGVVGSDGVPGSHYSYQQTYNGGSKYSFGTSPTTYTGLSEGSLANPDITWERDRKMDLGLDINLFKNTLSATIDVFRDIRYDEFVQPSLSNILGVGVPYINAGKVKDQGFDGIISYHNNIGKVQYSAGFVFSYAKNTILQEPLPQPGFKNLNPIGLPIGQTFGYKFIRYYTQADIDAAKAFINEHGKNSYLDGNGHTVVDPIPVPAGANSGIGINSLHAGDLMYKDGNEYYAADGVIDKSDQVHIGYPNLPNTTLGLNLGVAYKGFSASFLFQGAFNYSVIIKGTGIEPFQSQFQPIDLKAWTPATAATAQFPRLSSNFIGTVNSPTNYPSDYWLVNAYYIRLKTIDIGWQLPSNLLPFHVNNARIYLSAYNLVTWDNFSNKYQQDPEVSSNSAGDQYINERVVNVGVQLGF